MGSTSRIPATRECGQGLRECLGFRVKGCLGSRVQARRFTEVVPKDLPVSGKSLAESACRARERTDRGPFL